MSTEAQPETYSFGRFSLSPSHHTLHLGESEIALSPRTFEVLLYLAKNPGRLITKDELLKAIWADSFIEESNLAQQIFRLRKAFAAEPGGSNLIVTIPGRGYQFTATVHHRPHPELLSANEQSASAEAPKPAEPAQATGRQHDGTRGAAEAVEAGRTISLAAKIAVATGCMFIAAGCLWAGWRWKHGRIPSNHCQLVVADFVNTTGDRTFDRVLKSALEIDLSQSPYISVMSESEVVSTLELIGVSPQSDLGPELAKQVCVRSNRQVFLAGSIASVGNAYLLMLKAADCYTGKDLVAAKAVVKTREDALHGLDAMAETVRIELGESKQSSEQFHVPIAQATTSSLDALTAYSTGEYLLGRMGHDESETLPLFLQAVELDPQFAMANAAVATAYFELGEADLAKPYYQKAFDLSDRASQKEKLYIRAHYHADALQDLEQGILDYQLWAETYPHDWGPWLDIAKEQDELGEYSAAIASAEQALRIDASRGVIYAVLARAYMHSNRFGEAKTTASHAVQNGKPSMGLHLVLLEIACREGDQDSIARELRWSQGKSGEWKFLETKALALGSAGRYKAAEETFADAHKVAQQRGLREAPDDILASQATMEVESGQSAAARATLTRLHTPEPDSAKLAILRAQLGEQAAAERFLAVHAQDKGTLMTRVYLPVVRSLLAQQRGKPLEALQELNVTGPYEMRNYGVLTMKASLDLSVRNPEMAAKEFQQILSNPGIAPESMLYNRAHLDLARADVAAGDRLGGAAEYKAFLAAWAQADPDVPLLQSAKTEARELEQRETLKRNVTSQAQ